MRMSQYIGLTCEATEFVMDMERFPQKENNLGMFDENIPLLIFKANDGRIWIEVVQISPWSSGPMFFTCLQNFETGERKFEWIEDPSAREYDFSRGMYYV